MIPRAWISRIVALLVSSVLVIDHASGLSSGGLAASNVYRSTGFHGLMENKFIQEAFSARYAAAFRNAFSGTPGEALPRQIANEGRSAESRLRGLMQDSIRKIDGSSEMPYSMRLETEDLANGRRLSRVYLLWQNDWFGFLEYEESAMRDVIRITGIRLKPAYSGNGIGNALIDFAFQSTPKATRLEWDKPRDDAPGFLNSLLKRGRIVNLSWKSLRDEVVAGIVRGTSDKTPAPITVAAPPVEKHSGWLMLPLGPLFNLTTGSNLAGVLFTTFALFITQQAWRLPFWIWLELAWRRLLTFWPNQPLRDHEVYEKRIVEESESILNLRQKVISEINEYLDLNRMKVFATDDYPVDFEQHYVLQQIMKGTTNPRSILSTHLLRAGPQWFIHLHLQKQPNRREENELDLNGLIFRVSLLDDGALQVDQPMAQLQQGSEFVPLKAGDLSISDHEWLIGHARRALNLVEDSLKRILQGEAIEADHSLHQIVSQEGILLPVFTIENTLEDTRAYRQSLRAMLPTRYVGSPAAAAPHLNTAPDEILTHEQIFRVHDASIDPEIDVALVQSVLSRKDKGSGVSSRYWHLLVLKTGTSQVLAEDRVIVNENAGGQLELEDQRMDAWVSGHHYMSRGVLLALLSQRIYSWRPRDFLTDPAKHLVERLKADRRLRFEIVPDGSTRFMTTKSPLQPVLPPKPHRAVEAAP